MLGLWLPQLAGFPASWDAERCNVLSAWVHMDRKSNGSNWAKWYNPYFQSLWNPPADMFLRAASPWDACIIVVPLGKHAYTSGQWRYELKELQHAVPNWSDGRNVIIIDQSDVPITSFHRRTHRLGHSLIVQSHTDYADFVQGFDVSIPIGFSPIGYSNTSHLRALWPIDAPRRSYLLSFKGQVALERMADSFVRHSLFALEHVSADARGRAVGVYLHCFEPRTGSRRRNSAPDSSMGEQCLRSAARERLGPSYSELLNTTFALCPAGRSPASYRMSEALASGAIPVFLSGAGRHQVGGEAGHGAYVPPLGDVVRWEQMSLHVHHAHLYAMNATRLVALLSAVSAEEMLAMQRGVREAWEQHLRPERVGHTLWAILRRRVSLRGSHALITRAHHTHDHHTHARTMHRCILLLCACIEYTCIDC